MKIHIPIEQVRAGDIVQGQIVAEIKGHPKYPNVTRLVMEDGELHDSFEGHLIEVEREGEVTEA